MKKILLSAVSAATLFSLSGWVLAQTQPPTRVPEPDMLWLLGIAAAVGIGFALKGRNK